MEKKYTMNEFKKMFEKAQMEIVATPLTQEEINELKTNNKNISDDTIIKFQTHQFLNTMMITSKLYNKLFLGGKENE